MEELERIASRLNNIQAVEPILSALRTIALGSRKLALSKRYSVHEYRQNLLQILSLISPHLPKRYHPYPKPHATSERRILLVIGSERGLCGAFNNIVVAYATQVLEHYTAAKMKVALMTLGTRAQQAFRRKGHVPVWSGRLSVTALPPYGLCCRLASEWLWDYERHELDTVEVIYNAYKGMGRYEPMAMRVLPPSLCVPTQVETDWPPIIETDPIQLYARVVELWLSTMLYDIMLESAAAEHSARYQLLDRAAQNAEHLIEELTLFLQASRQESITSEMQNLASAAGLIGPRTD